MYNAPAVRYPVGRSAFQGLLLGALALLVIGTEVLWLLQADSPGRAGLGLLLGLLGAGLALAAWWRMPAGWLQWDGGTWRWQEGQDERSGRTAVRLDWQSGLLLECQSEDGRRRWCWLERRAAPTDWAALRRAVYASVPAGTEPSVDAGASSP